MLHTYNIRLLSSAAAQLEPLIHRGLLIPSRTSDISGCKSSQSYHLAEPDYLKVVDDFGIELGGKLVQVNLFRLPTWAYRTLLQQAGGIAQYPGVELLISDLCHPMSPHVRGQWTDLLCTLVQDGRIHSTEPYSACGPSDCTGDWLVEATQLCRTSTPDGVYWTLVLAFKKREQPSWDFGDRVGAIGLDVGADPLVVGAGEETSFEVPGISWVPLTEQELRDRLRDSRQAHLAKRLHHLAHTAAARRGYEVALNHLTKATVISVEDLSLEGMTPWFRGAAYQLALQDFLQSWLPQLSYEHGIPLIRVDPAYTSRVCHRCHRKGVRSPDGRHFTCSVHGSMNAHRNAAQVVRQAGVGQALSRLQNHSWESRLG